MTIEPWADAQLSEDIPRLAQGGESETVEFKRELPKQVRDLAKEIAAFASSSGGRLLLGVADDGSIPGVENGVLSQNRRNFRHPSSSPATSASRSIILPSLWKV